MTPPPFEPLDFTLVGVVDVVVGAGFAPAGTAPATATMSNAIARPDPARRARLAP
jgi:hypothetical protein